MAKVEAPRLFSFLHLRSAMIVFRPETTTQGGSHCLLLLLITVVRCVRWAEEGKKAKKSKYFGITEVKERLYCIANDILTQKEEKYLVCGWYCIIFCQHRKKKRPRAQPGRCKGLCCCAAQLAFAEKYRSSSLSTGPISLSLHEVWPRSSLSLS